MECMGVAIGCGYKEVYRFRRVTIPIPLELLFEASASLPYIHFFLSFSHMFMLILCNFQIIHYCRPFG